MIFPNQIRLFAAPGVAIMEEQSRMALDSYFTLGRSGLRVSPLCLGTMTFGQSSGWGCDEAASAEMLHAYMGAGGNFIDTADVYAAGESERIVGRVLKAAGIREEMVIATKFTFDSGAKGVNAFGNGRKNMMRAIDDSLRRLDTDYVDLYWMHAWDTVTPVEEVVQGFDALIRTGKIRYYGLSDVPAWYAVHAVLYAAQNGLAAPIALQLEYSLLERSIEREHLPAASHFGLGLCSWSPLAGGALSGKYRRGDAGVEGRLTTIAGPSRGVLGKEQSWVVIDALLAAAQETGQSPAAVALNWAATQYRSASVIIGATRIDQLRANLAALDFELPEAERDRLHLASRLPLVTPYDFFRPRRTAQTMGGPVRGWEGFTGLRQTPKD